MRKTLYALISLLAVVCLVTSCLGDATETTVTSDALISSFSINDIETSVQSLTADGNDTTITVTTEGDNYTFTIDQTTNRIYNHDSLPVGTDITKVTLNIDYIGYFVAYEKNQTDTIWSSSDSLDFTNPVTFKVYAYDGTPRSYHAQINVHLQDPDSLQWSSLDGNNFSVANECRQKAVQLDNRIYVFAENDGTVQMTSTGMTDGVNWSTIQDIGLEGADYASVIVFNESFYILAQNQLYTSADGLTWSSAGTDRSLTQLFAVSSKSTSSGSRQDYLYGISDGQIVESTDAIAWTELGEAGEYFPTGNISYTRCPLPTNTGIERTLVIGTRDAESDTTAVIWSKLSTEQTWSRYHISADNVYGCPKLVDLTVIHYDDDLYAFGGAKAYTSDTPVDAFGQLYHSIDHGVTWDATTEKVMLPESFRHRLNHYSCLVDSDNYIWIMWSGLGEVWKGKINRLGYTTLPTE